jgi:hypothetical protein
LGSPRASLEPPSADARPLVRGSPETKPRTYGTQSAQESLSTVVSTRLLLWAPTTAIGIVGQAPTAPFRSLLSLTVAVVAKQVVHDEAADRWLSGEGGMQAVHVVEVQPAGQRGGPAVPTTGRRGA